jgi:hypothetical protein
LRWLTAMRRRENSMLRLVTGSKKCQQQNLFCE